MSTILPVRHQPPLPLDQLIRRDPPGAEAIEMDVVIVGAGPAGLACAIELARLAQKDQEAGGAHGASSTSPCWRRPARWASTASPGAVVNPARLPRALSRSQAQRLPLPPAGGGRGGVLPDRRAAPSASRRRPPCTTTATTSPRSARSSAGWASRPRGWGSTCSPAFRSTRCWSRATRCAECAPRPRGSIGTGSRPATIAEPTDLTAKVTVLAEGTRGLAEPGLARVAADRLGQPADLRARREGGLGDEEVRSTSVVHTLGWPLPDDAFGGSFMYPLGPNLVALGLVVGLDYHDATLDVHELLQRMKLHPLFRRYLEGGEMVEWGAKTIPEGGYLRAARAAERRRRAARGRRGRVRGRPLAQGHPLRDAVRDLRRARDLRGAQGGRHVRGARWRPTTAWWTRATSWPTCTAPGTCGSRSRTGSIVGGLKAGLMTVTGGRLFGGKIDMPEDAAAPRRVAAPPSRSRPTASSPSASWTRCSSRGTRRGTPSPRTCSWARTSPREVAEFYTHVCPAGVYERVGDELRVNAPNCIDCKATDVLGPRWTPARGRERAEVPIHVIPGCRRWQYRGVTRSARRKARRCSLPADCVLPRFFSTLNPALSILDAG